MTKAETIAHFLTGNDIPEPHTALEDVIDYELPILTAFLKQKKGVKKRPVYWGHYRLRDLVEPANNLSPIST